MAENETLIVDGKPLKPRIETCLQAQTWFGLWEEAGRARLAKAAVVEGMFNGNPPYNRSSRAKDGQNWRANFNTLDGASRKDSAKTPYYDLFNSTKHFFEVTTTVDEAEGLDAGEASSVMTVEFDKMLKRWKDFRSNVNMMLDDFIKFNKGFFWWRRDDSWRFNRLPWHRVYFPDGTTGDTDSWDMFGIRHSFTVEEMWNSVRDEERAEGAGWNVKAVMRAINRAVPDWDTQDPMEIQRRLSESTVTPTAMACKVQAASVYWRELDGSWSRMMVPYFIDTKQSVGGKPASRIEREGENFAKQDVSEDQWLFKRCGITENVCELMASFFFELDDGTVNTFGGLGKKIVSMVQANDRIANRVADNTMLRMSLLLQAGTASSVEKLGLIAQGNGVTVIPNGLSVVTGAMQGDIQAGLVVSQDFSQRLDVNTGVYRPQFEKPRGNPESATAAGIRFNQATVLSSSAVDRFLDQLDWFGKELFRRANQELLNENSADPGVKSAVKFQKKLKELGVSKKQIKDAVDEMTTRAMRAVGNGSVTQRQQAVNALGPLVGQMGQRGLEAYQDDYVAAFMSTEKVERYFPKNDREKVPTIDDWQATRENNDMQQGAPPLLAEGQNNEVHVARHPETGFAAVQAVEEGADPTSALMFLGIAVPHIAEHIQKLGREQIKKEAVKALKQLEEGLALVESAVEEAQGQQEQQQNLTFEQGLKQQDTQAKLQERQLKLEQQMSIKNAKFEQDSAISNAKTMNELQTKNALTANQIANENARGSKETS